MTPSETVEFDLFKLDNVIDALASAGHGIDQHLTQLDQLIERLKETANAART